MKIGILGGGLSGVTLRRFLNHNSEILEKEDRAGGLCRTFEKNGFLYDIGGHILFSRDNALMDVVKNVLNDNINYCTRNNRILYKGLYVKYPFENGLGELDREDIYECLIGFLVNHHPEPLNFLEWIYHTFGSGLAEKYLIPYNSKIWKIPLETMGLEWVERVPKPPVEDIVKSSLGIETEGYLHQLHFLYPLYGGIEGFIKAMAKDKSGITTGFEINSIKKAGSSWLVSDGRENKYFDKLVCTIPVKDVVKYLEGVPRKVSDAADALRHNSVRVVLIGVNNESLLDRSAVYIPSPGIIPHRICYMGYFSKNNVPSGKSSLIAEITTNHGHELYSVSDDVLVEKVADDLKKENIINANDIIETDIRNFEYGYVVYDTGYRKNIGIIRSFFNDIGIELHGRFAEFEYINMDEVVRRSMNLSEKLNREAEV
jgi:protoporphyrinogen oxidase